MFYKTVRYLKVLELVMLDFVQGWLYFRKIYYWHHNIALKTWKITCSFSRCRRQLAAKIFFHLEEIPNFKIEISFIFFLVCVHVPSDVVFELYCIPVQQRRRTFNVCKPIGSGIIYTGLSLKSNQNLPLSCKKMAT